MDGFGAPRGLGLGLGPSRSTGPVGHSRVWPCPGPRAGGFGLGFGPSRSTGPVGHSRVWPCPGPRAGGLGLGLGPFQIDRPCWALKGLALSWPAHARALAFSKVFQGFSEFFSVFYVFQGVSGFVTLNSDEGPPPRPFHSLVLVKGGSYFSILKAK